MKNIDKLVEALQKGESIEEVVRELAPQYEAKLRGLIYPMEAWEAPFWAAACIRMADAITDTVPYSDGAIESMLDILDRPADGQSEKE